MIGKAKPKVIKNVAISGKQFAELVTNYTAIMNSSGIPNIVSVWDRVVDKEFRKVIEKAKKHLTDSVQNEILPNLPMSIDQLIGELNAK